MRSTNIRRDNKTNKHTNEESELRIHFYLIIEQIN